MKSLVLAEKPSVARELARVLKCSQKGKGYLEGSNYVVTWALGHLVTLAEPEDYDNKLKEWRLEDLPMLPERMKLKVIRQTSQQFNVVKSLMNRQDVKDLIIATDAGREGELVARWIMEMSRWKKPFKRLWISSQTDDAVKEGFARLQPGKAYDNLYDAAVCRAEADWLIGLNVTRTLTCKFNAQLNAGRVQTPTLAMMVKREKEIKLFKPVDYWTVRADFGDFYADWQGAGGGRLFDEKQARDIEQKVKGLSGTVSELKSETKSEPPPLAYDLTELQRDANRRFAWSAQKTLSVLQDLYEKHKIVTYPRTDSRHITTDLVPTLPARLKAINTGPYAGLVKTLMEKSLSPTRRLVDNSKVSDHHAIIPTEQAVNLNSLDGDEKKLFDLIARRFIAVLYPPFRYEQTTIVVQAAGETFVARGKTELAKGWKAVQTAAPDREAQVDDRLPEQNLRQHRQGEATAVKGVKIGKHKTQPPPRYNEATLLTAMEHCGQMVDDEELRESIKGSGLGTPATRAEIIEKLIHTSYIERHGKELLPTSKGMQLIDLVPAALRSPELTAQWEQQLTLISRGQASKAKFSADIRRDAAALVQFIRLDEAVYKADNISKQKCPLCGKNMLLVNAKRGRMLSCPDRSCGYRQPEKTGEFNKLGGASRAEQKLIARYSDKEEIGTSLGDVFKAALARKEAEKGGE